MNVNINHDYCECCGKVEVYDGKVCKRCEEVITRDLALTKAVNMSYNGGVQVERMG